MAMATHFPVRKNCNCLVVLGHPSEKYESIGMIIPNIWENKIDVPNHQPGKGFPEATFEKSSQPTRHDLSLSKAHGHSEAMFVSKTESKNHIKYPLVD